ncbi:uncharacterized protein LOC121764019 isoform X2 [Salvia splendens]|uniref:uncharacterized protein LOC121764019 isoform X2 n=1 Tax=Salvia splendens TaxID=180675 RepID=UPI001C26C9A8|nr:uncharacterized protein LOC121764019 isoform X2 [Salvia splendens]
MQLHFSIEKKPVLRSSSESTLLKLKQGSRCNPICDPEDYSRKDAVCIMAIESPEEAVSAGAGCSSAESLPMSSSSEQSTAFSNEAAKTNMSILHIFSKHKSTTNTRSPSDAESLATECGYSSSSSVSSSSSDSQAAIR